MSESHPVSRHPIVYDHDYNNVKCIVIEEDSICFVDSRYLVNVNIEGHWNSFSGQTVQLCYFFR